MSHTGPPPRKLSPAGATPPPHQPSTLPDPHAPDPHAPDPHAPDHDQLHDQTLVARAKQGLPGAWQELLAKHQDRLYAICLRMLGPSQRGRELAADLTQDALVKIIQGLHTFDGNAKVSTWMIRVTMNTVLSWQRAQRLRDHASIDQPRSPSSSQTNPGSTSSSGSDSRSLSELLPSREPHAELRVQTTEARTKMAQALANIEPDQRALLVLRDVRGLDYAQIAHVLEVPVGTVKSRLFRARITLREAYEKLA
jgi:RNA polymerase sigma-70 factor (ECF subfamily)